MATIAQALFSRGELSPLVQSRIDIDQYGQGLAECKNFSLLIQGPMRKRPGTGYIAPTKDQSTQSYLFPFIFNAVQAYVLEFGDHYIRFFALRGQVKLSGTPYEIVSPYAVEDIPKIKYLEINDIIYLCHQKYPIHKLTRKGETNWTIEPVSFFDGPYLDVNLTSTSVIASSSGKPAGTGSPVQWWDGDNIGEAEFRFTNKKGGGSDPLQTIGQYSFAGSPVKANGYAIAYSGELDNGSFDSSNSMAPRAWTWEGLVPGTSTWVELDSRVGEANWIPGETRRYDYKNANETPYQAYRLNVKKNNGHPNIRIAEIYVKIKDLPMTLTFSSVVGINKDAGFTANDIGRYIRFKTSDGFWKNLKITSVTSPTVVVGLFNGLWSDEIKSTVSWQLGAFSKFTGYPGAVSDFEGRLVFGGTIEQPRNLWFSSSIDLEDFAPKDPVVDSAPINITLTGNQQNSILWLSPGKGLFVGTTEGVTTVTAGDDNPLSYKNIRQLLQTNFGSSFISPVRIGPAVLYVSYYTNCIRELLYAFSDDTYDAPDISYLSEHLLVDGISEIGWAKSPANELYVITNSGYLVVMAYDRVQKIVGFTPYVTDGFYESVAVIPGVDGKRDDVYVQIRRTINGVTKRYIEYFNHPFTYQAYDEAWLLDSALVYDGAYTNIITGLSHLEGKEVGVFIKGIADNDGRLGEVPTIFGATVQAGQIMLPSGVFVNKAIIGLSYEARAKILRSRSADRAGETYFSRKVRADRIVLDLYRSAGIEIQGEAVNAPWDDVVERVPKNLMDQTIPLYTGLKDVTMEGTWGEGGVFSIRSIYPLPVTLRIFLSKLDRET